MLTKLINQSFFPGIRTLFFAVLAAFALVFASVPPVLAQDQPSTTFKNAILSVNPEYDHPPELTLNDPVVLVMYEGEIVSDRLSKITLLVPAGAFMYSAGSGPRTQYSVGDSLNRTASNVTGWDEVSFIPRTNYFVVEYYTPIQGNPDRMIPFDFRTLNPISNMRVIIQEPRRSTNFKVTPEGTVGSDQEGFKAHVYNIPLVNPDQPLLYDITYTKPDTRPSTGAAGSSGGGSQSNTTLILIVIGVIVVLGAAFFFLPQFQANSQRSRSQRCHADRVASKSQGKNKFCRDCGTPVKGNDRFCPSCGKPL